MRPSLFICDTPADARRIATLIRKMPRIQGGMIQVCRSPGLRDRHGAVHAGSFLRERRIALACTRAEFPRIFIHELFHFVWLHAGNPVRLSYEKLLRSEHSRGELGWSAEWRKDALTSADRRLRTRRWRDYCCESFCDTAAWMYSGLARHDEFTLAGKHRQKRRRWFREVLEARGLSI